MNIKLKVREAVYSSAPNAVVKNSWRCNCMYVLCVVLNYQRDNLKYAITSVFVVLYNLRLFAISFFLLSVVLMYFLNGVLIIKFEVTH